MNTRQKRILLSLTLLSLLSLGSLASLWWGSKGLSGQVIDARTGQPLPATVQIIHTDLITDVQTDAQGRFETRLPGASPLALLTQVEGYEPIDMSANLPWYLPGNRFKLGLQPNTLTGTVIAADTGQPLPGLTLSLHRAGLVTDTLTQTTVITTNQAGGFSFQQLSTGSGLVIHKNPLFFPKTITYSGQTSLTIALQPRLLTVTILEAGSDWPITQANIQAAHPESPPAESNAAGQATLSRLPADGVLEVSHPLYQSQIVRYHTAPTLTVRLSPSLMGGTLRDARTGQPLTYTTQRLNGAVLSDTQATYRLNVARPSTLTLKLPGYRLSQVQLTRSFTRPDLQLTNLKTQPCQQPQPDVSLCVDILLDPFEAKAIYVPFALLSRPDTIRAYFDLVENTELTALVIDVKGDYGQLAWDSAVEKANLMGIDGPRPGWLTLSQVLEEAHARDIYVIARFVVFKDDPLAQNFPDLAVTYANGVVWTDGEGLAWANPHLEDVWQYNIDLMLELAALGFDEINLDYIRFPSDGDVGAIAYSQENTPETRTTAIRTFASRLRAALQDYDVFLSADVFGLTVWVNPENGMNIGQRVIDLAPSLDYLAPMIYPSTFIPGNLGLDNPSAEPYTVIYESTVQAQTRVPPPVKVRPWLQAYWYSVDEMLLQKQAAAEANSSGWVWWNAGGNYPAELFQVVE